MTLPPGQHAVEGFPRFGTHLHRSPPVVPDAPVIAIPGAEPFPVAGLTDLPRREVRADFHCVAGWTATDLRWEGVRFADFYRDVLPPRPSATHVVFTAMDGFWSYMSLEDALADDVLIADRLDGEPLDGNHGAPVRLVCPAHYGFVNTKHLCRIELRDEEPADGFGTATSFARLGLKAVWFKRHPRARVWEEERHRYLPGRAIRPIGRLFRGPTAKLSRS